jgi:DNA-binding transcriptional MerR regulator
VRTLKTSEAAALLGVSPNTLRTWERRFGFPRAMRSPHQHRRYAYAEVIALHGALQRGLSISSAVSLAANGLNADSDALVTALSAFRGDVADEAVEASLALRSVERTINDVVLASLNELRAEYGVSSASWAFAADWAVDWFRRAERFGAARHQRTSVLVGDAAGAWTDPRSSCPASGSAQRCCRSRSTPRCASAMSLRRSTPTSRSSPATTPATKSWHAGRTQCKWLPNRCASSCICGGPAP